MEFPPGPKNRYPGQYLRKIIRDPLGTLTYLSREYGDISRIKLFSVPVYFVSHPDGVRDLFLSRPRDFKKSRGLERAKVILGEGLLTSEGETHVRSRRLVQPAFHKDRFSKYAAVMVEEALAVDQEWETKKGETLDIYREMTRLTLLIAARTLFGANLEHEVDRIRKDVDTSVELFKMAILPFSEYWQKLPLPGPIRFRRARKSLNEVIFNLISERRREGTDRGDLLSELIRAQDTEGDGGHLTDQQLRDEATTLLIAGHETTASALSWTWYLLSRYPEVAQKLKRELDSVLGDRIPTHDDVPRLSYTRMVFSEALRLYPPAWGIGRKALVDTEVAGYKIPKGGIVLASPYVMHRDERFYDRPAEFDPERWRSEVASQRPKLCYFPFGAGPRQCIGEQFAWEEGVLVLATLACKWAPRLNNSARIEPQALITLRPRFGIPMRLETHRPKS